MILQVRIQLCKISQGNFIKKKIYFQNGELSISLYDLGLFNNLDFYNL